MRQPPEPPDAHQQAESDAEVDDAELRLGCRDILFISVGVAGAYLLRGLIIVIAFAIPIVIIWIVRGFHF